MIHRLGTVNSVVGSGEVCQVDELRGVVINAVDGLEDSTVRVVGNLNPVTDLRIAVPLDSTIETGSVTDEAEREGTNVLNETVEVVKKVEQKRTEPEQRNYELISIR